MSSLRVENEDVAMGVALASDDSWVEIVSPVSKRPAVTPVGVVLSLADLRSRYRSGGDGALELPQEQDYGSGDRQLADDIAESMASRWDD